ncbi:tetratricopeptide repeat protein [Streptomyces sp. NPDC051079]|uniref:tetratricopeptide repeat protein n=1 Tax=Streptomyces sp. NPDC051079 TaxID=3155043 RepID=UPI0034510467
MAGREHELAVLRGSIRDGAGLLTLTGPPGPLKSRLLREALRREGVEALWEPADLLTPENLPALARLLRRRLAAPGAPRVLVLDGWERLGPRGAALVAGLLREAPAFAPGLTVLVTALRALRLKEEQVLAVAQGPAHHGEDGRERGRECGRDDTREDAREAPREDGREAPREAPREDPREDGPSALQLAAAESGYARCDPLERLLWERISVFEGSFGREAVREVCASGALPAGVALDVLDRLAPLALLPVDDGDPGEERYWMPPPMRTVGARRLTERGDRWAVVLRHRRWYAKVARRATDWWQGGRQLDARALALLELPDLAAAMDPTTAPLSPAAETDTAVEIAVSLWFLWVACGRVAEGRSRLRHALALHPGPAPARALWLAAYLELEAGRPEDADPLLVQSWAAAVREGDDKCLAMLAHLRGSTALYQGRTEAAAAEFRDALEELAEYPDLGPTRQLCWTALALARVRTDPEAAQEALDRADVHSWAGRDVWADAWAQYARAELHYWDGEPGRAAERATRALREHLRIGCVSGAACAAELLAQMRILRGRPTTAAHLLGAADLLRSSAYEDGYRPARFCSPSRERSESALREHLSAGELRRAYEEGARRGLHALVAEP